jgi:type IV pilus assembly protein PilV
MATLVELSSARLQRGALMIEVLVTIVILAIGLLGMMQMQGRLQKSEMESYQRTQAVILVNDMASRISSNRAEIDLYLTDPATGYLGVGGEATLCAKTITADKTVNKLWEGDSGEWCRALQGAGETQGTAGVGAMVGARGCVELIDGQYTVTVVWQGLTPISAPPLEVACGANLYNLPPGSACAEPDNADKCRRYVTTIVTEGILPP